MGSIRKPLAAIVAAGVLLIGLDALLLGWIADVDLARHLSPELPGTAISTTVGLIVCSSLILTEKIAGAQTWLLPRMLLAAAMLLFAAANLTALAMADLGIDQLVLDFPDDRADVYMSAATSICLAAAAACLLLPRERASPSVQIAFSLFAGVGFLIASLSFVGHLFDAAALHHVLLFGGMGIITTGGFLLLFVALPLSRPDWGIMRIVTGSGLGSFMLRRTLPIAVLGPLVLCWLTLLAVEIGLFEANFRLSVLAVFMMGMLIAALTWAAVRLNTAGDDLVAANTQLQQALGDRDILLKEVYHRVKNNLQFVDAMLALEANRVKDSGHAETLAQIRSRLHAMGLVHHQLVNSHDLASVSLKGFLEELCRNLVVSAGLEARRIEITVDAVPVTLHLEQAIPVGLIVSELVYNAVKHAFPDGRRGEILVLVEDLGSLGLRLCVSDSGVGSRDGTGDSGSAGSFIVRSLANQLGAEMTVRDIDGYHVELLFTPIQD